MKAIVKKLYQDFWRSFGKLFLCILAAIISAWGISTVVYSYLMSERDFKSNFSSTVPADFILTIQSPSVAFLHKLSTDKNIQAIERRELIYARTRKNDGSWMPIILYGVDKIDKPSIMKFTIVNGKEINKEGIYIEKNGKKFISNLNSLQIQIPGDTTIEFQRSGFVHDPGMAPSQMDQLLYGYTSIENIKHLLRTGYQRILFKTNLKDPSKGDLQSEVDRISLFIKDNGSLVLSVIIPEPGTHPHQGIVEGISFLQQSFGVILFLLGVILLSLILLTWLYPQLNDIGVLKAIGSSTTMIFLSYVVVLASIVVAGLLVGLPLGYNTAVFYNSFIANLQNFIPVKERLPLNNHLIVIVPALFIPLLIGLIPLNKMAKTSVHDALNKIFYTPHKMIFKLSQQLFTNSRITYGFNNLFRSNQRTTLLIALLTIGISLFISGYNLRYSINNEFSNYYKNSNYNLNITLKDTINKSLFFLEKLSFVESVAYTEKKKVSFQLPDKTKPNHTTLKIYSRDFKVSKPLVLKGIVDKKCSNCLFINQIFKSDFKDIILGSPIELIIDNKVQAFTYAGIYKEIGQGSAMYIFSDKDINGYKEVSIQIKQGVDLAKATQQIDDTLLAHDIDVAQLLNISTFALSMDNHLKPTYFIIQVMGLFTIIIGILGMLIVLNLSLKERVREMGIMKALGGSVTQISYMFAIEYFIINTVAALLGIFTAYGLTYIFCRVVASLGLNLELPAQNDYTNISWTLVCLLLIQTITILAYSKFKVKETSSSLLNTII